MWFHTRRRGLSQNIWGTCLQITMGSLHPETLLLLPCREWVKGMTI
jgi:hypothetical protein